MKRYFVFLNGTVIKDFTYRANAESFFAKMMRRIDKECDVLYAWDRETGHVFCSND